MDIIKKMLKVSECDDLVGSYYYFILFYRKFGVSIILELKRKEKRKCKKAKRELLGYFSVVIII